MLCCRSPSPPSTLATLTSCYGCRYFTHGSWSLLWPTQLLILRISNWRTPWKSFWRRHIYLVRTTAQMVASQDIHLTSRESDKSPVAYILKKTAFVTTALTVAGGSWYVAVDMTSASDLTAIYNCSAFWAYAFSIPLLHDKLRFDKAFSVLLAIAGVLILAYGDSSPTKHGGKSGGSVGGGENPDDSSNRTLGNIVIGVGSVLYGLYEVLYKKLACPPEGTSPGRGMVFANTFGSLIGCFTLFVLWIPLPILHYTGLETFEWPRGEAAWMLLISVLANATFSGSFLVLISLTSPVLSSVAALLTIFIVAVTDWLLTGKPLSPAAITGGLVIVVAFLLLSWSTYREMDEERRKRYASSPAVFFSNTDFKAGYRRKSLRVAMTSRLICFLVQGMDTFRHGDGVEDALYLDISWRILDQKKKSNRYRDQYRIPISMTFSSLVPQL